MSIRFSCLLLLVISCLGAGCANITAPTGGRKDTRPPRLLSVTPADSLKNTRVSRVEMYFDEYVTVNDPTREVQLSPQLAIAPVVTGLNKHVVVKIIDSLLEENTTYRLTFGNAIKDLHEGNAFTHYTYTFSTGSYFDSLQLHGTVKNAMTGLSDLEGVIVELYYATDNDSAVVRHKPKYVVKAEANGQFVFKGLPRRTFRIYALKDANENMIYDGPGPGEMIGFVDNTVVPDDTSQAAVSINVFAEIPDTSVKKSMDSANAKREMRRNIGNNGKTTLDASSYSVNVDTNQDKRTFDITGPVNIIFGRFPLLNEDKISLSFDSGGVEVPCHIKLVADTAAKKLQVVNASWKDNTVYTLRLAKGFAKDTAGKDLLPSRYSFRTKEEDVDYGKLTINLPGKYRGSTYLLRVMADNDSVYERPVTDTTVVLRFMKPAKYTFRIIVDKNHNGHWDTGDLLKGIQPEEVIPCPEGQALKAGWEDIVDFEPKAKGGQGARDKTPGGK